MGAERRSPELSVVRIPLIVEALGPALPLLLLHSAHGAKGLWNQGDSSPKPVTPHFLITFWSPKSNFMPRSPQLAS